MSQGVIHPMPAPPAHGLDPIKIDQADQAFVGTSQHRAASVVDLAHPPIFAARKTGPIKGTLRGGESTFFPDSGYVAMGGSAGKIDKVAFQATMYGQVSGNTFEGGTLHLYNSSGEILTDLGPGKLVVKGKTEDLKVGFEFDGGIGSYSQIPSAAGTVTIVLKHTKSAGKASETLDDDHTKSVAKPSETLDDDWDANWDEVILLLTSPPNSPLLWSIFNM